MSPFEVIYGFNPLTPTDLLPLPSNEHLNMNGRDRAQRIKELHQDVKKNLEKATAEYARQANRGRREMIFHPGDWVWLNLRKERFPAKRRHKLSPRGDGPFKISNRINNNAYQLELPADYGNINPTFNVSDLTLFERWEEEDNRLMDQPPQEGGNDVDVNSRLLAKIHFPNGPVSRKRIKTFIDKIQQLMRELEDQRCEEIIKKDNFSNFKKLLDPQNSSNMITIVELAKIEPWSEVAEDPSPSC